MARDLFSDDEDEMPEVEDFGEDDIAGEEWDDFTDPDLDWRGNGVPVEQMRFNWND